MAIFYSGPSGTPNSQLFTQTPLNNVAAIQYARRNSSWQQVPSADTIKQVRALAVANLAVTTIWTPGAGNLINLKYISISVSVAGRFTLRYNTVTILDGLFAA